MLRTGAGKGRHPLFLQPKFHFGLIELMAEMERLAASDKDRIRTVIELSNLAVGLLERPAQRAADPTRTAMSATCGQLSSLL